MKGQETFFSSIVDAVLIKERSIRRQLNQDLSLLEAQRNWIIRNLALKAPAYVSWSVYRKRLPSALAGRY